MSLRLYDTHNHFQDPRLIPHRGAILTELEREGLSKMVINGTSEKDWPDVLALAQEDSRIIPSFGLHPWYVRERSAKWQSALTKFLEQKPAGIGEIGLDRWIKDYDMPAQEEVFLFQLRLAAERNLPVSIHCLRAWGRLLELLKTERLPACGFLIHSYGGPEEMVEAFVDLGGYFSISGYFAQPKKAEQRRVFSRVPLNRLLIETDAPDMLPPSVLLRYALNDSASGEPLNHPANIGAIYRFVSEFLEEPIERLSKQVEANFQRLFGSIYWVE